MKKPLEIPKEFNKATNHIEEGAKRHWLSYAEGLEKCYNELSKQKQAQDVLIVKMKNREGILLGFVFAAAFSLVVTVYLAIYWSLAR